MAATATIDVDGPRQALPHRPAPVAATGRCETRSRTPAADCHRKGAQAARRGDLGAQGRLASRSSRARCSASSAATARASRRCCKLLTRITTPTRGQAVIRGRVGSLLEVGTGFHPELTGRENIYLNGAILGMRRREITRKLPEIVDFAGVATFLDTPVKRYSSGMYVRLAFSVAAHLEPEILLVDEVLAVGDAEFQQRCLGRMEEFSALRPHGRLRLPPDAVGRAAVRPRDPARRRRGRPRRARATRSSRYYLQSVSRHAVAARLARSRGRSRRQARDGCARYGSSTSRASWLDSVDVRQPVGVEMTFTVLRDDVADVPEDQALRPRRRRGVQRARHERRLGRAGRPLGTTRRPRGSRPTSSTRACYTRRRRRGLQSGAEGRHVPSSAIRPPMREAVSFHVHDPGEGDSSKGTLPGAPARARAADARVDDRTPLAALAMQIVGVMLVHNEDEFVEQALRNAAGFCDRFHVADHMSTDGTWDAIRRVAAELDHVERCARSADTGDSHALVEGYAGTDTWVFGVDGDELYDPAGLAALPRQLLGGAHREWFSLKSNVLNVTELDRGAAAGLPGICRRRRARSRSSSTSRPSSPGRTLLPAVHARRRDRVPARLRP